jgi:hypothetical protein
MFGFGAIYMMYMNFKITNAFNQNKHGLHLQSKYNDVPEAAEEGPVEQHSTETTAMQEELNLNLEETHTTSNSVTSNEPSAKPSESNTAPPSTNTKTEFPSSHPSITPTMSKQDEETTETTTISSELQQTCPDSKEEDSSSLYPPGFPQVLRAGDYTSESAHPYLSKDIWAELVDNKRTFFLRPYEDGFPNRTTLREWVASRPHPITILMNNYMDLPFPPTPNFIRMSRFPQDEEERMVFDFMSILNETNLHALYVENFQEFAPPITMEHPKIKRLPRGHKWQFRTSWLYGESKAQQKELYTSISSSPQETKALFEQNRTATVWVRRSFKTTSSTNIFF